MPCASEIRERERSEERDRRGQKAGRRTILFLDGPLDVFESAVLSRLNHRVLAIISECKRSENSDG